MARVITYPTKYKTLAAISPVLYSDQNTEVNQIYQDLNDLDSGMALKGGESTQDFISKLLTTNDIVHKNYNINDKIEAVKDLSNLAGTVSGAIEIILPQDWFYHTPMFTIRLRSSTAPFVDCIALVKAQMHDTLRWRGAAFTSIEFIGIYGNTPLVKFGYKTIATVEYPTIIIGDHTVDSWFACQVQIESIWGGYSDLPVSWLDRNNYSISLVTALTDYTNQFDIIPSIYGDNAKIAGNLEVDGNAKIDDWIELAVAGVGYSLIHVFNTGRVDFYSNAYLDADVAKLRVTGTSWIEVNSGGKSLYSFTGTAGDTITITNGHTLETISDKYMGLQRLADGNSSYRLISAAGESNYNAILQRLSGANGILKLVNKGTGDLQFYVNDTTLALALSSAGVISGAVETPTLPTVSYGTHVNITGAVTVTVTALTKINSTYTMSFAVSATVTTASLTTIIRFNLSGLTFLTVNGTCNGQFSGADQSLFVRLISTYIELVSPSANAAGALTASGTVQFTV